MIWGKARKKLMDIEFREVRGEREEVHTREGTIVARKGFDYIIRGVEGELYPIDRDIFNKTYRVIVPLICSLCGHAKGLPAPKGCSCSCHH